MRQWFIFAYFWHVCQRMTELIRKWLGVNNSIVVLQIQARVPFPGAVAKWHYLLVWTDWLLGPQHQIPSLGIASFLDWVCLYAVQSLHWICKNLNNARYFHVLFLVAKLHNNESLPQYGIRKVFMNKITYLQKHIDIGFWFHSLMTPCDRRHFFTLI